MPTPNRQLIIDDVYASLAPLINGFLPTPQSAQSTNPSKTKINRLERVLKVWTQVKSTEFPWLGFGAFEEDFTYIGGNQIAVSMQFTVVAHVVETTMDDHALAVDLSALQDDIIAALNVNTTRQSQCVDTKIKRAQSSEGESAAKDTRGYVGSMELKFVCKYLRTVGSS